MMLVYAAGIGVGSGVTFFASTILLLDYFGRAPNLELFSIVNLISTIGSAGPVFEGFVADRRNFQFSQVCHSSLRVDEWSKGCVCMKDFRFSEKSLQTDHPRYLMIIPVFDILASPPACPQKGFL